MYLFIYYYTYWDLSIMVNASGFCIVLIIIVIASIKYGTSKIRSPYKITENETCRNCVHSRDLKHMLNNYLIFLY